MMEQQAVCWAPAVPASLLDTIHAAVGASPVRALQLQDQQQQQQQAPPTSEAPRAAAVAATAPPAVQQPLEQDLQSAPTGAPAATPDLWYSAQPQPQPQPRFDAMDEAVPRTTPASSSDQAEQPVLRAAALQPGHEHHQQQRQLLCELWCHQQQQEQQQQRQATPAGSDQRHAATLAHSLARDLAKAAAATACSSSSASSPVSSLDLSSSSDSSSCLAAAAAALALHPADSTLASPASSVSGSEACSFHSTTSSCKKKKRVSWGSVEYRQLPPPRTSLWHQLTCGAAQLSWPTAAMLGLAAVGAAAALATVVANHTRTGSSS